ncbi:MAG TPA: formylglycine-generating enzyme family protein [Opitutaceae bacterium]
MFEIGAIPECVPLPIGEFIMGETKHDKFSTDTERPAHRVDFAEPFALGRFPVTIAQFRLIFPNHAIDEDPSLPVVNVSWDDAAAYCDALAARTGKPFRLPSEAEWEFACRAGSRGAFSTGSEIKSDQANFLYSESGDKIGRGARSMIGEFPANAFGLYDLHGNVCEWVADVWHPDYRSAPCDGSAWIDGADYDIRVIRGGGWDYLPRLLRSAWRDGLPRFAHRDNLGFRVAYTLALT